MLLCDWVISVNDLFFRKGGDWLGVRLETKEMVEVAKLKSTHVQVMDYPEALGRFFLVGLGR